jgi:predicted nucleic acid-binding protein
MIFVDTNYFNRYLLQDIPEQSQIVNELIQKAAEGKLKLISTDLVFFEVCWSLQQHYKLLEQHILELLYELIAAKIVSFQENEVILRAIRQNKLNNLGIEDNYNLVWAAQYKITEVASFDKKFVNSWNKST